MVSIKILKKNHIIISIIALMLITAGYFNYIENIDTMQTMSNSVGEEELAAIGEAKLVDSSIESNEANMEGALVENDTDGNPTGEAENVACSVSESEAADGIDSTNQGNIVSTSSEKVDDYFASSRLERNTMYSEMISTYERMIENPNVSETQKGIATNEIYNINSTKNAIMICENLIKNKGFEDVIIFANGESINVIVKANDLHTEQIAQIQNIILRELNSKMENIHISCKN